MSQTMNQSADPGLSSRYLAPIPPEMLLAAYGSGVFPMADDRDDPELYWVEPRERAILPLDGFRLSTSLRKVVRQDRFIVTTDRAFGDVVVACAAPATARESTWISRRIEASYHQLFAIGHAHSVECWQGGQLVGGLYGVSLGRAFFGESMFHTATDASKVALAHLVARLLVGGFTLLDCQFHTDHLESLGAMTLPQRAYLSLLQRAVSGVDSGAGVGAAAGAGDGVAAAGGAAAGDWAALDRLAAVLPVAAGAGASSTATSPGQLIVQLLMKTS
jgi:leucyl/phenylalanyl-tRNA---protein transferase